jgi:hypothetical protein
MPRTSAPPRRLLLSSVFAVVLAAATAGLALTLQPPGLRPAETASQGRGASLPRIAAPSVAALDRRADGPSAEGDVRRAGQLFAAVRPTTESPTRVRPEPNRGTTIRPSLEPAARSSSEGPGTASRFRGRNHVWIPALGIDRSISAFPCSRTRPPDNYVYRWSCAGRNNVYLLGHAHSVFEPLHDAYVKGTLRKGMEVVYADGSGRVRTYAVTWWRVTRPTSDASWAWAPLARPSMTLQTCVGADGQYRLIVRLVARH